MDVLLNDADDLIELITMLFFTPGGEFYLEDEVLHDVEEEEQPVVWGGSRPGKAPNLERHRVMYSHLLYNDFWGATPIYNAMYFRKFFKIPIGLFNNIVERIVLHDNYFIQRVDACGRIGLSTLQKVCSAFRLLTSGVSSMEFDDKYRMAASTGMECFKRFCKAVIAIYSEEALRHPTLVDINRLLDEGQAAGFPGCLGSIDCMHWEWKNCPSSWKGMFQGSLNDINVLDWSPLFFNAVRGEAPSVDFTVNHHQHSVAYWLADGIYPNYACFVKTIPNATTRMQKLFVTAQESKRKDIERAFGILQARFHILTSGCRLWDRRAIDTVMRTCVILHNLVLDYEREHNMDGDYINDENYVPLHDFVLVPRHPNQDYVDREMMIDDMQNVEQHNLLQHDLMVERWEKWFAEFGDDDMDMNDIVVDDNIN